MTPPRPPEGKLTCENCIPRTFNGGYKDVLLCQKHLLHAKLVAALEDQTQFLFSKGFETEARELRALLQEARGDK